MQRYADAATDDWHWFEDVVSYANAKLPHALILSGRCLNNAPMLELGLKTLRWLVKMQTSRAGAFRPIGSNGFYPRGQATRAVRSAAHRGAGHGVRLHRGVSRHEDPVLGGGSAPRVRVVSGSQRSGPRALRRRPPAAVATACTWTG